MVGGHKRRLCTPRLHGVCLTIENRLDNGFESVAAEEDAETVGNDSSQGVV